MTKLLGVLAAAIVALGMAAPKAGAVVIYDWSGLCDSGCVGQANAVLTLEDSYVPGTELVDADFISFFYSSSSGAYDIPADAGFDDFSGFASLPGVSGPGDVFIDIDGPSTLFSTQSAGSWLSIFAPADISDGGAQFLWTLRSTNLTAPGPLSLLALGLAGLALAGRRRWCPSRRPALAHR